MRTIFCLFILLVSFSCTQEKKEPKVSLVTVNAFSEQLSDNVQLVDVRRPEEFANGHLPGAKNINVLNDDFANHFSDFDKDETIYLYCKAGGRSAKASLILKDLGFIDIVDMEGGYTAWTQAGLPTTK